MVSFDLGHCNFSLCSSLFFITLSSFSFWPCVKLCDPHLYPIFSLVIGEHVHKIHFEKHIFLYLYFEIESTCLSLASKLDFIYLFSYPSLLFTYVTQVVKFFPFLKYIFSSLCSGCMSLCQTIRGL